MYSIIGATENLCCLISSTFRFCCISIVLTFLTSVKSPDLWQKKAVPRIEDTIPEILQYCETFTVNKVLKEEWSKNAGEVTLFRELKSFLTISAVRLNKGLMSASNHREQVSQEEDGRRRVGYWHEKSM